jgi:hypothetical protein
VYANMERWTEIRQQVLTGQMSRRAACRHYGLHWLTLKKILEHDEPPGYRRLKPPRRPKIDSFLPIIHAILDADRAAPRKQRHTAHRIWQRLRDEHGFAGGYAAVVVGICQPLSTRVNSAAVPGSAAPRAQTSSSRRNAFRIQHRAQARVDGRVPEVKSCGKGGELSWRGVSAGLRNAAR